MSTVVMCPQCQTAIEVPGDLADLPLQCHRCMQIIERGKAVSSAAIQVGITPMPRDPEPEPRLSPPHREARAPFPVVPMFLVLMGILFFLLVMSAGFNVYMLVSPDNGFRVNNRAAEAEATARKQQMMAEQALQAAEANRKQAELNQARLQKQLEDLRRERDDALLEVRRLLAKDEK